MASHQSWQWTDSAVGLSLNLEQLWGYTSPASLLAAAQAEVVTLPIQLPVSRGWKKPGEFPSGKNPTSTKLLLVRPNGPITCPLIGEAQPAGMT